MSISLLYWVFLAKKFSGPYFCDESSQAVCGWLRKSLLTFMLILLVIDKWKDFPEWESFAHKTHPVNIVTLVFFGHLLEAKILNFWTSTLSQTKFEPRNPNTKSGVFSFKSFIEDIGSKTQLGTGGLAKLTPADIALYKKFLLFTLWCILLTFKTCHYNLCLFLFITEEDDNIDFFNHQEPE